MSGRGNTLVTFTDADGDEFPMIVIGFTPDDDPAGEPDAMQAAIEQTAREKIERAIAAGEARPTKPLRITKVEVV